MTKYKRIDRDLFTNFYPRCEQYIRLKHPKAGNQQRELLARRLFDFFIYCIVIADDWGVAELAKATIFNTKMEDIQSFFCEQEQMMYIYEVNKKSWYILINYTKFQYFNHPYASNYPLPENLDELLSSAVKKRWNEAIERMKKYHLQLDATINEYHQKNINKALGLPKHFIPPQLKNISTSAPTPKQDNKSPVIESEDKKTDKLIEQVKQMTAFNKQATAEEQRKTLIEFEKS